MNEFKAVLNQEGSDLFQKRNAIQEIVQNDLESLKKDYIDSTEERN